MSSGRDGVLQSRDDIEKLGGFGRIVVWYTFSIYCAFSDGMRVPTKSEEEVLNYNVNTKASKL